MLVLDKHLLSINYYYYCNPGSLIPNVSISCIPRSLLTSLFFLYTNNEISEKECKKIPFKIASRQIKYLEINQSKEVKDLYAENYKTLIKEIEDDSKKWKDIPCLGLEEVI